MNAIVVEQQRRDRITGISAAVIIHALLLLLFLFVGLTTWDPPLPEDMVEVEMLEAAGGLDGGMPSIGDDGGGQPTPAVEESQPEDVATEEESEVVMPKPDKPKPRPVTPKPPKPNPNALFQTSTNPSPAPGDTPGGNDVPGDKPGGGGAGDFKGPGFEGRLEGRGLMRGPNITDKPDHGGKVALNIWVDRAGKVTRVTQNLDKSTTTSQVLFNIAKKGAQQCTFSARADGPAEQIGMLVFIFELE
jgi:hypothetical protein